MHANIVLAQDVLDYAPLFVEIADAYFERELYAEARPIYELLGQDPGVCLERFFVSAHLMDGFHGSDQQSLHSSSDGCLPSDARGITRSRRSVRAWYVYAPSKVVLF
jgi:hypothetical protein